MGLFGTRRSDVTAQTFEAVERTVELITMDQTSFEMFGTVALKTSFIAGENRHGAIRHFGLGIFEASANGEFDEPIRLSAAIQKLGEIAADVRKRTSGKQRRILTSLSNSFASIAEDLPATEAKLIESQLCYLQNVSDMGADVTDAATLLMDRGLIEELPKPASEASQVA